MPSKPSKRAVRPERLFDPALAVSGSRVKAGLGLFTCHRIVREHRGEISVASDLGLGTTVTIRLTLDVRPEISESEDPAATGSR